jgi:uncharacterized caspase-like protein
MRKALIVGINYYSQIRGLYGCVHDAHAVKGALERNGDGTVNFSVNVITAESDADAISRKTLKTSVRELFAEKHDVALLYFAGHGHVEQTGGYLCSSDCSQGDDGLSLAEVMTYANQSPATNKVIFLDSCHSGVAGTPAGHDAAEVAEGVTILTASTEEQYATEKNGSGVFTSLLVDALKGAAANLVGDITPGAVYAHIDQSLGPWEQRPVFKTNVQEFVSLRRVTAPIPLEWLLRLTEFFPRPGMKFHLDPSFEPELSGRPDGVAPPDPENTAKFAVLQRYNRVNLLVPVDAPHMWHAAMASKDCKLTALGEHYRRLVEKNRI